MFAFSFMKLKEKKKYKIQESLESTFDVLE